MASQRRSSRRSSRRAAGGRGPYRIGLVSDTHGLYREELQVILGGVEEILHAGDVGKPEVLERLRLLAPVSAVKGNVDVCVKELNLPSFLIRDLHGVSILITHYSGMPEQPLPPVAAVLRAEKPRLILSGHTHMPLIAEHGGVLFVNPGSCGPRRFRTPISCGLLTIQEPEAPHTPPKFHVRVLDLESGAVLESYGSGA
ncbi:MAG: metallophosphatase family protein [Planctomycetota bacterium]|nr:metallophosphatase family protein [Planctomycetota bacterium]